MPENNEQHFKFTVSNSAQKAQFCKRSGNRQWRNGHNGDDLADFGPITTKSWFIMATSRYNCATINQKLCWNRTKFGNIGPIVPIVSWWVFRALAKVGYWGRIRDCKFKRLPNVYDHCAVTAARTSVIFHIRTDKYTSLITDLKKMSKLCIFTFCRLCIQVDIENLEGCSLFLITESCPLDQNMWYFTYLKKSDLASFLSERNPRNFTFCGFNRLLK